LGGPAFSSKIRNKSKVIVTEKDGCIEFCRRRSKMLFSPQAAVKTLQLPMDRALKDSQNEFRRKGYDTTIRNNLTRNKIRVQNYLRQSLEKTVKTEMHSPRLSVNTLFAGIQMSDTTKNAESLNFAMTSNKSSEDEIPFPPMRPMPGTTQSKRVAFIKVWGDCAKA
jgi:hypothetical protein